MSEWEAGLSEYQRLITQIDQNQGKLSGFYTVSGFIMVRAYITMCSFAYITVRPTDSMNVFGQQYANILIIVSCVWWTENVLTHRACRLYSSCCDLFLLKIDRQADRSFFFNCLFFFWYCQMP